MDSRKKFVFKILFLLCVTLFGIFISKNAQAAILYFSPSSGNFTVGNILTVNVLVNTESVAINNAEAVINFPKDFLEIVSVSKSGSIFSLWVEEPTFSNSAGTLSFNGGLPTPGFNGTAGKILSTTFRVKKAGSASLVFSSAVVRANDGYGTNVFKTGMQAFFNLISEEKPSPPEEKLPPKEELPPTPVVGKVPEAPQVSSPTHPDPEKWYSNNAPEFTWKLPIDVTGVSLLLHKSPTANPGPISDGLIESKKYEDVEDGVWYFHIKFRNQYGWGKITHRKVLIDTTPPEPFEIRVDNAGDSTNPTPILYFDTTDFLSRLEYYEVEIGEGDEFPLTIQDIKENPYRMPFQAPGKHLVEVKAFDKAGNSTRATTEIEILPIKTPIITEFPKSLSPGQNLILEGESLPDAKIKVFVQKEKEEPVISEIKANAQGKWSFLSPETLEEGEYQIWVQAQDERGSLSLASPRISFLVGLPPFLKFGKVAISYSIIMITLIVLIVGVVAIILYAWYRISLWRKRLRKETKEVAQSVAKAFRALREEVQEQIEYLDKKPGLTKAEKEIRDKLQEALNISEEFIGKEIKDVEKELE